MADKDQILADMADIVNDITGVDQSEVTFEKSFVDDLDVDSLSMVEIIYACDEKFGVEIPDEESKNIKTVGDAVNYIQKLEAENPEAAEAIKAKLDDSASE